MDFSDTGPSGSPAILYCHGTPGSRLEPLMAQPALERCGVEVRLVAVNRPGYGASTFVRRPGFLPWARDAGEVMDHLGIRRAAVLGASGGAPFALACAQAMPDRIEAVGIVAGVAPPDCPGMQESATISGEYRAASLRALRYGALSLGFRAGLADSLVGRMVASLGRADRLALDAPDIRPLFAEVCREAFSQGGRAAVLEAGLFLSPWDVDPDRVRCEIRIWHGGEDTRIPARAATSLAERLPAATVVVWPRHGHFSWATGDEVGEVANHLIRRLR